MVMIISAPKWDGLAINAVASKMRDGKKVNWAIQAGQVFFKHRRAGFHLNAARKCVADMIAAMQPIPAHLVNEPVVNSAYSGPLSEQLYFHLDGFLEAERASLDHITGMLENAAIVQPGAPPSLSRYVGAWTKRPRQFQTTPAEVADRLHSFWTQTGKTLKLYRDCFTHYVTMAGPTWEHSINMKWSDGVWKPYIGWPDDPSVGAYLKFTYDQRLDAIAVCSELYSETDKLLRQLIQACLDKWEVTLTDGVNMQFAQHAIRIGD